MNGYNISYELFRDGKLVARRKEYVEATSFTNAVAKLGGMIASVYEINVLGC